MNALVSIIINNYNYGKFISHAIDSSIAQTYPNIEIIVVDDGSTDDSQNIILKYKKSVKAIFKANGGQASAFNEGIKASKGDIVIFLDSDDMLFEDAIASCVPFFDKRETAKVHWPLKIINETGDFFSNIIPSQPLSNGDYRKIALTTGPPFYLSPPTSGNAWNRDFIMSIYPLPEKDFRLGADQYLFEMAALFGTIESINIPKGAYRVHSSNNYYHKTREEKFSFGLNLYNLIIGHLIDYSKKLNIPHSKDLWYNESWYIRQLRTQEKIFSLIPENTFVILIDDGTLEFPSELRGINFLPFLEKNNQYNGLPEDDSQAISEINRLKVYADYIVFTWASYWWLDHYNQFGKYLQANYKLIFTDEDVLVFSNNDKKRRI